jgi:chromosome segregation ATPase
MTEPGGDADDVFGEPVADAARVLGDRIDADPSAIESALRTLSEDGAVTAEAVDDAVGDASLALSTAEGRVEYAAVEVQSARDTVADASDSEFLRARASELADRRRSLADERDRLQSDLQAAVEKREDPAALYDLARELQRLKTAADDLQGRADRLAAAAGDLAGFVEDPVLVLPDVEADADALDTALAETETALETLADGPSDAAVEDPEAAWFETWTDHRFRRLAIADIGAEIDALDALHDDEEVRTLADRHADLVDRWQRIDDRLVEDVPGDWVAENEGRMEAVADAVEEYEPPIDWGAVEARRGEFVGGDP